MRLLFIDDDPSVGRAFARTWRGAGIDVTVLDNPRELERALAASCFDVVVTDYEMPSRNGVEVLSAAKRLAPGAVRVLLSASLEQVDKRALSEVAPVGCASKPIDCRALIALVA